MKRKLNQTSLNAFFLNGEQARCEQPEKQLKLSEKDTIIPKEHKNSKKKELIQLIIDAGQDIGPITCPVCSMVYSRGEEEEKLHKIFHTNYLTPKTKSNFIPKQWEKQLKILQKQQKVSFIVISSPAQSAINNNKAGNQRVEYNLILEKAKKFQKDIDTMIGFTETHEVDHIFKLPNQMVYFAYLNESRKIIGSVVVVPILQEERMNISTISLSDIQNTKPKNNANNSNDNISNSKKDELVGLEVDKVIKFELGISRIWVHPKYRRQHVASHLLTLARCQRGQILDKGALVFSSATSDDFFAFLCSYLPTASSSHNNPYYSVYT